MADKDMRQRIKEVAVEYFNNSGYHGTTIRSIAKDVACSLPMIYYYYENKKELFDEIIKKDYFDLLDRQAALLRSTDGIIDFYTKFVYDLNFLSDYDKRVYRLGIKVYLSFDGDEELMKIMDDWEKTILPRHRQMLKPYLKNAANEIGIARTLVHVLETLIQSIVVKNRFLPEEEIREEISTVLREC
jgi:AcrR family transcriptional regulator